MNQRSSLILTHLLENQRLLMLCERLAVTPEAFIVNATEQLVRDCESDPAVYAAMEDELAPEHGPLTV
jgi:hypothetical protein